MGDGLLLLLFLCIFMLVDGIFMQVTPCKAWFIVGCKSFLFVAKKLTGVKRVGNIVVWREKPYWSFHVVQG